jgi:signal transduction histidine kinase
METKNIEKFFLSTLLQISIGGVLLILTTDSIFYPQDKLSIIIDCCILTACVISYFIRGRYQTIATLIMTSMVASSMFYQCLVVPSNTTTSLSVLLIVGFIFSVMLKGRLMTAMHIVIFLVINAIFYLQFINPSLRFSEKVNDVVTVAITYSILYFILTYATAMLKFRYDRIHQYLHEANKQMAEKATEIEAQNEELTQMQDNLNEMNRDLEQKVIERTEKLNQKNQKLIQYSYTNAHHLRGPVARLLGLVAIRKLDPNPDNDFFFEKVEQQAHEVDAVVRQINIDLGSGIAEDKE